MAFHNRIFAAPLILALALALALASNNMSVVARRLLDTSAVPSPMASLPKATFRDSASSLVLPLPRFARFPHLPRKLTRPALMDPTSPQTPWQPQQIGTILPQLPTNPLPARRLHPTQPKPLLPSTQVPSHRTLPKPTLPLLPDAQIPALPTLATLQKSISPSLLSANPTSPGMSTDPTVKILPPLSATVSPSIPTRIPSFPIPLEPPVIPSHFETPPN